MQQLEKALLDLAQRAEPLPLDVLILRVENQLAFEGGMPAISDADIATGAIQTPGEHLPKAVPLHRRKAWAFAAAFVLIIASVGIAALALRDASVPVADEPATPITAVTAAPQMPAAEAHGGWEWMAVEEPWLGSVVDVAPLPGDGFVVAAVDDWSVLWSPDGITWRDADPERQVEVLPLAPVFDGSRPQVIAVIGDQIAVLDSTVFGIKVGDLETQSWESIEFDTSDLPGEVGLLMVAANDTRVLVVGYEDDYAAARITECGDTQSATEVSDTVSVPEETRYFAWVVDSRTGDVERHPIPATHAEPEPEWYRWWTAARVCEEAYGSLAWHKDQWVLNLGELVLVSPDGVTWTQTPNSSPTSEFALVKATLIAGPETLIARSCGMACGLAYSEIGTGDWIEIPEPVAASAAYSDIIGYVSIGEFGEYTTRWGISMSSDGRHFTMAEIADPYGPLEADEVVASGNRVLGVDSYRSTAYLLIYSAPDEPGE